VIAAARAQAQRGQSMVEVTIACAVMVPLLLLVPILGKYAYMRHTAQQATRAAAWEATVVQPGSMPLQPATRQKLLERFYAGPDARVLSNVATTDANAPLPDPLLNTHSNQPLLERADVVLQAYRNDADTGLLGRLGGIIDALPGDFPPNRNGLVSAQMQVTPQVLRYRNGGGASALDPFDAMRVRMDTRTTLLVDAWNASGPGRSDRPSDTRSVVNQVKSLTPSTMLGDAIPDMSAIDWLPVVGVIGDLDPGYIAPDVVPVDKINRNAPTP
jgi:Tfp pilus assembly protein PilV